MIFNNKKTGFWSIISYHEGTDIPAFFPLEYKEQEREDIFNTIDHEVEEIIKKVEAIKLNTGNKKLDAMFKVRVKGTKEQLEGFKKLKYLEAEKLWYTFPTEEVREKDIEEAQTIVLQKRKQLHQQPKQIANMKSYLKRLLEKNQIKLMKMRKSSLNDSLKVFENT
jgi:hypothetical protein